MLRNVDLARFAFRWMKSMVSYPIFSCFFIPTRKCNLKCVYCYQADAQNGIMSKSTFSDRLKFLKERGLTLAQFTGGEIMLWPYLGEALAECKRSGIYTSIATNGTLLSKDVIFTLKQQGLD